VTERLSSRSPAAAKAVARRQGAVAGAVHFGPGAFHRVHQAWYFDRLMERDRRWAITGVSLKSPSMHDALAPQDGLYVLAELDQEKSFEVIGAITSLVVAERERERVLQLMASPDVGWISATVTEKGYCLDGGGELDAGHTDIAHDLRNPRAPESFVGYLAEGLRRRRAASHRPPAIVSCDNLADNGRLLKRAVVQFAREIDPDLAQWIEGEAAFPRTMVDSITPATDDALRGLVRAQLDVDDAWPVQRERFVQWVIEDCLPPNAPDLASVGAEITSDVGGYERAKLRLLNGAHSSLAYLGLLRGHETVAQAMADRDLATFIEALMREDIAPTVRAPRSLDVGEYISAVLGRFRNPAIRHLLSQIAWDGSKKLPFRLLETVSDARAAGSPVDRLCLPIAGWFEFIRRQALRGTPIVDPLEAQLSKIGRDPDGTSSSSIERFLRLEKVFRPSLVADAVFVEALKRAHAKFVNGQGERLELAQNSRSTPPGTSV
jgi:fructuronate reductase